MAIQFIPPQVLGSSHDLADALDQIKCTDIRDASIIKEAAARLRAKTILSGVYIQRLNFNFQYGQFTSDYCADACIEMNHRVSSRERCALQKLIMAGKPFDIVASVP